VWDLKKKKQPSRQKLDCRSPLIDAKRRRWVVHKKPYKVHQLFRPRTYAAGFKSKAVRDQFNRGLAVIKANGKYQAVLDKYLL
jgi:ABC-type amino acid transport substrate-binding protein